MRSTRLSALASPRSAIVLGALVLALNVAAIVVMTLAHDSTAELVRLSALLPTVVIGTLVAVRRPRNPMGWLMLLAGLSFTTQALGTGYAILDYHLHRGTLPLGRVAIAFQPGWAMGMVFISGLLWLFPDGYLPSGRWRRIGGVLFASGIVWALVMYAPSVAVAVSPGLRVDADAPLRSSQTRLSLSRSGSSGSSSRTSASSP